MIRMTVRPENRQYIQDKNNDGYIDSDILNSVASSDDENFNDIQFINNTLVNKKETAGVSLVDNLYLEDKPLMKSGQVKSFQNSALEKAHLKTYPTQDDAGYDSYSEPFYVGVLGYTISEKNIPYTIVGDKKIEFKNTYNVFVLSSMSSTGKSQTFSHEFLGHLYLQLLNLDYLHDFKDGKLEKNSLLLNRINAVVKRTYNNSKL